MLSAVEKKSDQVYRWLLAILTKTNFPETSAFHRKMPSAGS